MEIYFGIANVNITEQQMNFTVHSTMMQTATLFAATETEAATTA